MKVLLVDDHQLLLEGLTNLLQAHGIQVVGTAVDGYEAIIKARSLRPDVILMDIRMPNCDGLQATRRIKAEMPDVQIVILTTSTEDEDLFEAVKCGACGYLLKSMDADELVTSLKQAQEGIPPFSPGLATKLMDEFARLAGRNKPASAPVDQPPHDGPLTQRQMEVLDLISRGLSYKEVGAQLNLSPRTIKYHMTEIMAKLHMQNRAQVLAYAGRLGLGCDETP